MHFVPGFPGFDEGGLCRKVIVLAHDDMIAPGAWCELFKRPS